MILLRDTVLPLTFLFRVFLLFCQTRFVGSARAPCWLSLSRHYERLGNDVRKSLLGCFAVSQLASRLARDDANGAFIAQARCESLKNSCALFIIECSRPRDVPRDLHARRCLVYVLTACA